MLLYVEKLAVKESCWGDMFPLRIVCAAARMLTCAMRAPLSSQVADVTYVDGRPVPLVTKEDLRVLSTAMEGLRALAPALHDRCASLHTRATALSRAGYPQAHRPAGSQSDDLLASSVLSALQAGRQVLLQHVEEYATSALVTRTLQDLASQLGAAEHSLIKVGGLERVGQELFVTGSQLQRACLTDTSAYGVVALDSVIALSSLAALCMFQDAGATDGAGAGASSSDDAWAALNAAVEATLLSVQNLVKEGETPYWGHGPPPTPLAAAPTASTDALAAEDGVPAALRAHCERTLSSCVTQGRPSAR